MASVKTTNIRVSTPLADMVNEIVRLNKTSSSALCERLFRKKLEQELETARARERERLNTLAAAAK